MTLWQLDQSWFRAIHEGWRQDWLDPVMRLVTDSGLGSVQIPVLLALLFWRRARPYAGACLGAFLLSGAVRLAIMRWADRMRPSNFDFAHPLESVFGNTSFPSGHTTTSFAIAFTLLFMTRGSRPWVGWVALGWACLVGLSRIYVGVHYPTDVLGGAGLGLASAAALHLWRNR
ncbi:MAG: phosphatase PAP2 family protein [Fimbriimonadaceae bacterium]|nr:phosphatase PAP2 family protein [Chthonomonadaceae bacterium]MCO5297613.1 phosphatase PAP2 family protein [Fimbriimonadaceae bacterium]